MNPKRTLAICTLAAMLSIGNGWWSKEASASDLLRNDQAYGACDTGRTEASGEAREAEEAASPNDPFLHLLGVRSEEQVRDALCQGRSLADIAAENGADIAAVIDLQVRQLKEQLKQRLLQGSITWQQYQAHKAELADIVARSACVAHGPNS